MFLTDKEFENVIKKTPMIAIDLCITDENKILLGKRINPPAKNYYFVPGGRIRKSETIGLALERILYAETGRKIINKYIIRPLGVFEHFYKDNFKGNSDFDSHYVVLAYHIPIKALSEIDKNFKDVQHEENKWFRITETSFENIHKYSVAYFDKLKIKSNS